MSSIWRCCCTISAGAGPRITRSPGRAAGNGASARASGLPGDEIETIEWLIRNHPADVGRGAETRHRRPAGAARFRQAVKTTKRLDLLLILTVCDIRGVGPGTWNNWKAMLLRKLHETTAALDGGPEN